MDNTPINKDIRLATQGQPEVVDTKSDFEFILSVIDATGTDIGFPIFDFAVKLWTSGVSNSFTASCVGGVCTNMRNDEGKIRIMADGHGLGSGRLHAEIRLDIPNNDYPDGVQTIYARTPLDIMLMSCAHRGGHTRGTTRTDCSHQGRQGRGRRHRGGRASQASSQRGGGSGTSSHRGH